MPRTDHLTPSANSRQPMYSSGSEACHSTGLITNGSPNVHTDLSYSEVTSTRSPSPEAKTLPAIRLPTSHQAHDPSTQRAQRAPKKRHLPEPCWPTREVLEALFDVPIAAAASLLDIPLSRLKRICRGCGIARWQYRSRQSEYGRLTADRKRFQAILDLDGALGVAKALNLLGGKNKQQVKHVLKHLTRELHRAKLYVRAKSTVTHGMARSTRQTQRTRQPPGREKRQELAKSPTLPRAGAPKEETLAQKTGSFSLAPQYGLPPLKSHCLKGADWSGQSCFNSEVVCRNAFDMVDLGPLTDYGFPSLSLELVNSAAPAPWAWLADHEAPPDL